VVAFGGRVAEELIFGKENVSTGASSDIRMATNIARRMVTEFGMSDKMGPIAYEEPDGQIFLGSMMTKTKNISDETALDVDREIHRIVTEAFERAKQILNEKREDLETLAQGLIEYETLTGAEIKDLLAGKKPNRSFSMVSVLKSSLPETEEDSSEESAKVEKQKRSRSKKDEKDKKDK